MSNNTSDTILISDISDGTTIPFGKIFSNNLPYIIMLFIIIAVNYVIIGIESDNKKDYFMYSGIVFGIIIFITVLAHYGFKIAYLVTACSLLIFGWFIWKTYQSYKDAGAEGLANIQYLFMFSIAVTIIISKFLLSSDNDNSTNFVQLISIMFTVLSLCIIYLIDKLGQKACNKKTQYNIINKVISAIVFFTVYGITGYHPLVALAISVALYMYYSFENNVDKGDDSYSEGTNMVFSMLLIIISSFKIMFPEISVASILKSKPLSFISSFIVFFTILAFITNNILYLNKAKSGTYLTIYAILAFVVFTGLLFLYM